MARGVGSGDGGAVMGNSGDALIDLARAYRINGDLVVCRKCGRGQQIVWREKDFHHREGCSLSSSPSKPWLAIVDAIQNAPVAEQEP